MILQFIRARGFDGARWVLTRARGGGRGRAGFGDVGPIKVVSGDVEVRERGDGQHAQVDS